MQRVTTFLWFDGEAEEAANHYVDIFRAMGHEDSEITTISRYGKAGSGAAGRPVGSVMTVVFTLAGQEHIALNGGPEFRFNEAMSLVVNCDTQEEIDGFWERLSAGGEEGPCGWLKDRYGLSWQVVPSEQERWIADDDPERSDRVMAAVLEMKKLDLDELRRAYEG
jgi:predicted 3-demethylubiquinone-9 3-methyltransferase (glyoxalase superfamily)